MVGPCSPCCSPTWCACFRSNLHDHSFFNVCVCDSLSLSISLFFSSVSLSLSLPLLVLALHLRRLSTLPHLSTSMPSNSISLSLYISLGFALSMFFFRSVKCCFGSLPFLLCVCAASHSGAALARRYLIWYCVWRLWVTCLRPSWRPWAS